MPTSRRRHTITETDAISGALNAAAERWPGMAPPELLEELLVAGQVTLVAESMQAEHPEVDWILTPIDMDRPGGWPLSRPRATPREPEADPDRDIPTPRRRHTITETDAISGALNEAAARWPEMATPELLEELISAGHATLLVETAQAQSSELDWILAPNHVDGWPAEQPPAKPRPAE